MASFTRFLSAALGRFSSAATAAPRSGPATVPDGLRVYAVGDIHGERLLLDRMIDAMRSDAERAGAERCVAVFLGDYVDRGPASEAVLERLCDDPLPGFETRFLLGNHEAAMLDFLKDPAGAGEWLRFGGAETLGSYGIRPSVGVADAGRLRSLRDALAARLPHDHRVFLEALEPYCVVGDYAFAHAGIRPGRPLSRQKTDDLLWIREPFLGWTHPHEKVIVHGHTVVESPELLDNRIGIDTGAYATGVLTAVVLSGTDRTIVQVRP